MEPLAAEDPRVVGGYQLRARLGAGGTGRAFLAFSPAGRPATVKVMHPELAADSRFRLRLRRAATTAHAVGGAYVAPVLAAGPDDDPPWLASLFVAGPSLTEMITQAGAVPLEAVRRLAAGLTEALAEIHRHGLVHLALKPANVLLAADGPRVADFWAGSVLEGSGMTAPQMAAGAAFMSPEQAYGGYVGPASDVFSLGSLLVFAATGTGPFGDGPASSVLNRVANTEPALGAVPAPLRDVTAACLNRDPAGRPTLTQVRAALRDISPSAPVYFASFWPPTVASLVGSYQAHMDAELAWPGTQQGAPGMAAAPGAGPSPQAPAQAPTPAPTQAPAPFSFWIPPPRRPAALDPAGPTGPATGQFPATAGDPAAAPAPTTPRRAAPRRGTARARRAAAARRGTATWQGTATPRRRAASARTRPAGSPAPQRKRGPADGTGQPARAATRHPASRHPRYPAQRRRARGLIIAGAVVAVVAAAVVTAVTVINSRGAPSPALVATLTDPSPGQPGQSFGGVSSVAFSPDGKILAVGGAAGDISLFDVASRSLTGILADPGSAGVNSLAFSPSGATLAAGDANGNVFLWDPVTRHRIATLSVPASAQVQGVRSVQSVAFSPDGATLADGEGDSTSPVNIPVTAVWNLATSHLTASLIAPFQGITPGVLSVAFSPGGETLAAGGNNGDIYLWNLATGHLRATLSITSSPSSVQSVSYSPDGATLAAVDGNDSVYLWHAATSTPAGTLSSIDAKDFRAVVYNRSGTMLAAADAQGSAYVWNLTASPPVQSAVLADPHGKGVNSVSFSPDGTTLATGDGNGNAYLWRVG